jgi:hypothetical protein
MAKPTLDDKIASTEQRILWHLEALADETARRLTALGRWKVRLAALKAMKTRMDRGTYTPPRRRTTRRISTED